ncbi:MAG: hypothetical protein QE271_06230 [Bacteriovoracaceae bacterium]|nr:hypothetical protein [Bacteriovoracaceae bacterium]
MAAPQTQFEIKELFRVIREIQSILNQNFAISLENKKQNERMEHLRGSFDSKQEELKNLKETLINFSLNQKTLESLIEKESKQIEKLERDIYDLKNLTEVDTAKKKLNELIASKTEHEIKYFEDLSTWEIAQLEVPKLTKFVEGFQSSILELQEETNKLKIDNDTKTKQNLNLINTHLDLFPPVYIKLIQHLIQRHSFKISTPIYSNKCGSCNMQQSPQSVQIAEKMLDITKCSFCGLILMPDGSFT